MPKASKILILVEGAKTDVRLMEHLLHIYGIDNRHEIVSYKTNIYALYNDMFHEDDPSSIDLLQLLKERETDNDKKSIFNEYYSDILLVFDLDPQDPQFSYKKISDMMEFFVESSDMGKLYLNYPMLEAFYHMKSIPDDNYINYVASLSELFEGTYKQRVNSENRNHDYSKFAITRKECNIVIQQNINKAWHICDNYSPSIIINLPPDLNKLLKKQLELIEYKQCVAILCTCAFYIVDYNFGFLQED